MLVLMPYSIAIGPLQAVPESAITKYTCTCSEAQKGCMPSFVYSVAGQVGFRTSLDHLLTCRKRDCLSLRKNVKDSMHRKLGWLFREQVLLGCVHVQPFLYKAHRTVNLRDQQNFRTVARHLAHCPNEGCARLRRALLLSVRDQVSPSATNRDLA